MPNHKVGSLLVTCNYNKNPLGLSLDPDNKSIGIKISAREIQILFRGANSYDYHIYLNSDNIFRKIKKCRDCKWSLKLLAGYCKKEYNFESYR